MKNFTATELVFKNEELKTLKFLMESWRKSGRVVSYFPMLHRVSLNGGPRITVDKAILKMHECLISQRDLKLNQLKETK